MEDGKATDYLYDLVRLLLDKGGSDIFITAGSPPALKIDDKIHRIGSLKLTPHQTERLVLSILNDKRMRSFQSQREVNFALHYPDVARFRVSAFYQRGSAGMVLRLIRPYIPTIQELNLPPMLEEIAMAKRGLVLFLGGTGSGKSTSLAAMLDHRNRNSFEHIITIEDPIEYFHQHKNCLVNQREVGTDAESYEVALQNALRQSPNVIMIGEIRTRQVMEQALSLAETGHLCLSTLHATNSDQALDRVLNFFPGERRAQVLMDLSFNIRAFISQRLIKREDSEGMAPAVEVLLNTPLISELILQGRIHEIKQAMLKATDRGMQTFDQSLFWLYEQGSISYAAALRHADSLNNLRVRIKLESKRPPPREVVLQDENLVTGRASES